MVLFIPSCVVENLKQIPDYLALPMLLRGKGGVVYDITPYQLFKELYLGYALRCYNKPSTI